ncbi:hypothetical protein ANCDUO_05554 [Ancylostoma duodenale]|uniref:Reverse transcriptase domain-containing protein n=1 Tax=Ancylostoma duodenale TaxID=51022 RepID=A0A0C2DN81_9BILA|nr:hypothetical protein ANCDUO_05554 [Ancylostoma duodenale]
MTRWCCTYIVCRQLLNFAAKSAPGISQQIIDSMVVGLNGAAAYLDDIIVPGRTKEEHRQSLEFLLERNGTHGFRACNEKFNFMVTEIRYLGEIIDAARTQRRSER